MVDMDTGNVLESNDTVIHAVKYFPEPVGYQDVFADGKRDPYSQNYALLHERDLPAIRNELGANALLLAPWSFQYRSHTQFLETAAANNLRLIPAFHIGYYWEDGAWQKPATREALAKDFHDFLQYSAVVKNEKLSTPETILMWNLVGLPPVQGLLPVSCVAGAKNDVANFANCVASSGDLAETLATVTALQEILQTIRETQNQFHCEDPNQGCDARDDVSGAFKFDRPLALTLDLGPEFFLSVSENDAYLRALIFWLERVVGCHPLAAGQVQVPTTFAQMADLCSFNGLGLFDSWILKMQAVADDVEARSIRRIKQLFSQPKQMLTTGTAAVEDVSGAMKPVLFEYGFPAYVQGSVQPDKQHRALYEVWHGGNSTPTDGLKDSWSNGFCIKGAVIDEWSDVWSADEAYKSCESELKSKFGHSSCGPSTDAGQLAVAYQGLVGQFHTFGHHCIQKRYETVDAASRFHFGGVDASSYVAPPVCAAVLMKRGVTIIVFYVACCLFILVGVSSLCFMVCRRTKVETSDETASQNCYNLEQLMQNSASRKILEDISAMPFGKLLATKVAEALDEGVEVPVAYSHLKGYCGWGLAKVGGTFSYHRLQYNGRGRGACAQSWDTTEAFIRWLQEQSDRSMAVYGFTDAELRRTELIGNKTVTRRHLLELLDRVGSFKDAEEVTGRAESQVHFVGMQAQLVVELSYKANPLFLSSVVEEHILTAGDDSDMQTWLQNTGDNMRNFMELLANTHLQVQADRLRRQIEHEADAVAAEEQRRENPELVDGESIRKRACYNIWHRVLEGYHSWEAMLGQSSKVPFAEADVHQCFAEALISRMTGSIAEHLIHSPEWLSCVHRKVMRTLVASQDAHGKPSFTCKIDYADICEPLEAFCRNSNVFAPKQGINFDDINDCGLLSGEGPLPNEVQKTWKEPVGLWVCFHFVVNYKWVLTIAMWLLWGAVLLHDSKGFEDWVGTSSREPTLTRFTFFSFAFIDALWLCFLMICEVFVNDSPTPASIGRTGRNCCIKALRMCRIVPTFLLALAWAWISWPEVVMDAAEAVQIDSATIDVLPSGLAETIWYAPVAYIFLRFAYGITPRLRATSAFQLLQMAYWKRIAVFWATFAAFSFLCNYSMLVALVRTLTPYHLCAVNDSDEDFCSTYTVEILNLKFLVKDVRCVACVATVVTSWTMVALSSLLMMYFIFNIYVAVVGSSVGAARGFVETSIPSLEFRVESVTSDFTSMRKAEANWMTHGSILHAVFGKDWQKVWEMMVDGLYDECLIDSNMRKNMLSAAKTGGSVKLTGKDTRILERAKARLGYLFTSLKCILGDGNINFRPFVPTADSTCDALGVTHRGRIPSLTQIVPVYSEEGIMDIKELVGEPKNGAVSTMLEFLISQLPKEWEIFAQNENLHPAELYEEVKKGASKEMQNKVREWASHRSQSVIRTVNGAVHYHRALKVLLEREDQTVDFEAIRRHAQLIMAHQTYGKLSLGKAQQVKIQHGVISSTGPHGLQPNDRIRLSVDSLNPEDAVAKRAVEKVWKSKAMARLKKRAKTVQQIEAILNDTSQVQALMEEAMQEPRDDMVAKHSTTKSRYSGGSAEDGTSSAALAKNPALLGRLWGQANIKGLQGFRSGRFYTVKEVVDEHTAVLSDGAVNCGLARLEKADITKRDSDVHYMMSKHAGCPFFVCIDFVRGKSHPQLEEMVDAHVGLTSSDPWTQVRFKHASVLIKHCGSSSSWPIEVVHVLPRARGLLIGSVGNLTQGKAGNQLGALRFAEGHFVQMMDANMGCYSGETFKVPVVLQGFHKHKILEGDYENRLDLQARIIGFREHIFTREHGLVGQIMADAEWTFGTLVQRLLEFLTVRMHYGHPDFMDGFWAANRGSVSKASPHINLSEDIFAGLNVKTRHEQSLHTDYLEWEKGREVQFLAGSGFFWKIASGSVGLMRTRDLRALCGNASVMETFALYFATVAWYVHNVLVDISTEIFLLIFMYLTLASKSISDLGDLGSMLAAEWFLTPAFTAMLPAIIGLGIEYGPLWMCKNYLLTAPMSMMYFIFINKAMSSSVRTTFVANTAEYVNTGRPHANKSYTLLDAFLAYWHSHYRPALKILYVIVLYRSLNSDGALPMVLVSFTAFVWILAPVLFQPPAKALMEQVRELVRFIAKSPSLHDRMTHGKPTCIYEAALEQELKQANRSLSLPFLSSLAVCILYLFMTTSNIFDQTWAPLCGMFILFLFRSVLRFSGIKSAGMIVLAIPCLGLSRSHFSSLISSRVLSSGADWSRPEPTASPLSEVGGVHLDVHRGENPDFGSLLVATLILISFLNASKFVIWGVARLVLPRGSPLGYEQVVRFTFDFLCIYEWHFFGALVVMVMQVVFASFLWLLDRPPLKLRTGLLLNRRVSTGCVRKIFGAPREECHTVKIDGESKL
ncbi:unnamed protein product [Effrenium voratum]|nr:unnamed protein product [Effrenium voratum]